jgi:hypothetical protein
MNKNVQVFYNKNVQVFYNKNAGGQFISNC